LLTKMFKNVIPTFLVKSNVANKREEQSITQRKLESTEDGTKEDSFGRTLLHRACWEGNDTKVRELLAVTDVAKLNAKDQWGRTPLWCAVNQGNLETVSLLVGNRGIKLDTKDSYGKDLIFRAKEKGFIEIIEVLEKEKQKREFMAIDVAVQGHSESVLREKLEAAENEWFDLEKKHVGQLEELETNCMSAVEKLLLENEEKILQLKDRQGTEKEMVKRMVETISAKLGESPSQTISSAPSYELPCPECPVCMENMLPPRRIMQCRNGHIICELCQPKLKEQKCPTCMQGFVGRAVALEQHLRDLFMT